MLSCSCFCYFVYNLFNTNPLLLIILSTGKYIDIEPHYLSMTSSYVFAASKENFYIWHFKTPKAHSSIEVPGRLYIFAIIFFFLSFFSQRVVRFYFQIFWFFFVCSKIWLCSFLTYKMSLMMLTLWKLFLELTVHKKEKQFYSRIGEGRPPRTPVPYWRHTHWCQWCL